MTVQRALQSVKARPEKRSPNPAGMGMPQSQAW